NVLDHHDRVVDDDAYRQYQTKQRQVVDGDAEQGEDCEGADQRYRNGDHGDDRRPPALQEQVDDADHQEDRDGDRDQHLVDGRAHERGRVIDVDVIDTRREALLELGHLVPDLVLYLDHVGTWGGDDPEGSRVGAIRIGFGTIVRRAQLDL